MNHDGRRCTPGGTPARTVARVSLVLAVALPAILSACSGDPSPPTVDRPLIEAPVQHSVSLGLEDIADPDQDWDAVQQHLEQAHVNAVSLAAGRVEWTAFDWDAHPDVAAEPGRDHLARAIAETAAGPDDQPRLVDLQIDALIPRWIENDPSVAGVRPDGTRSVYTPSASALHDGAVGERILELVAELARRYQPDQITLTELKFDQETFGDDDAALYRTMTGEQDWPRDADGEIRPYAPEIGAWRSQVLSDFLGRAAAVLDDVGSETGKRPRLGMDALIDWEEPSAGDVNAGLSYTRLAEHADVLVLWVYLGLSERSPEEIEEFTAALTGAGLPSDVVLSVGLWDEDSSTGSISPELMANAVRASSTHGITAVNVTPYSRMTPEHWTALSEVWTELPPTMTVPTGSATPS